VPVGNALGVLSKNLHIQGIAFGHAWRHTCSMSNVLPNAITQ